MKQYLLLFRNTAPWREMSKEESDKMMAKWGGWMEPKAKAGKVVAGAGFGPMGTLVKGTAKAISSSLPKCEEGSVNGFVVLKTDDEKEVMEFAKSCPILEENGSVELREAMMM